MTGRAGGPRDGGRDGERCFAPPTFLIGTLRRACLDHVVVLNNAHLRWLLRDYLAYYHSVRTHLSLDKDAPEPRPVERLDQGGVVEMAMVGGLHHRYTRLAA